MPMPMPGSRQRADGCAAEAHVSGAKEREEGRRGAETQEEEEEEGNSGLSTKLASLRSWRKAFEPSRFSMYMCGLQGVDRARLCG
mmetsp:Transcript_83878/g.224869  ORF Transcript_83878/g.224869 Transcript_83878/m.224869 type:complete len:85 (+) Transcript_83878:110-364(+)